MRDIEPREVKSESDTTAATATAPNPTPPARVKDIEEPTFATYLILRRRLGEIVAQITQSFQRLDESAASSLYRTVEARHADVRAFISSLPRAFDIENPDKRWDKGESFYRHDG